MSQKPKTVVVAAAAG